MATNQSRKIGVSHGPIYLSLCHSETEWDNALYVQNIIALDWSSSFGGEQ